MRSFSILRHSQLESDVCRIRNAETLLSKQKTEPAEPSARLLGLGTKLHPSHM